MAVIKADARIDGLLWACTECGKGGVEFSDKLRTKAMEEHPAKCPKRQRGA